MIISAWLNREWCEVSLSEKADSLYVMCVCLSHRARHTWPGPRREVP